MLFSQKMYHHITREYCYRFAEVLEKIEAHSKFYSLLPLYTVVAANTNPLQSLALLFLNPSQNYSTQDTQKLSHQYNLLD